ncbi:MAG TPA: hypothetical protein VJQ09_00320 [Candidatus Limnocylindria bacterium]|nr:hypothetical protein [Candidatus Limnocylindria bacterium]
MRRFLQVLVFATAAGAAAAAGSGVVVAPHVDPPNTPLFHTHVFAAYRLPLFLGVLRARFDPHQGLVSPQGLMELEATAVLALLALLWPRLPRPTLRAIADVSLARIANALWRSPLTLGPPRAVLP